MRSQGYATRKFCFQTREIVNVPAVTPDEVQVFLGAVCMLVKKKKSGLFQYFIGNHGGVHPVLHQKLDRADSSSVRQTRGGLITTFCQFKTCDKATFALKTCLILQKCYMLCKTRHLLSPSRLQEEKVHHLFFPWLLLCLGSVRHASVCSTQYQFIYAELCCLFVWFHCPLRFQTWWCQPTAVSTWQQVKNALKHKVNVHCCRIKTYWISYESQWRQAQGLKWF